MAFTRICFGANSAEKARMRFTNAAFEPEYAPAPSLGLNAAVEETNTIRDGSEELAARSKDGIACLAHNHGPRTLTAKTASNVSVGIVSKEPTRRMPAQHTNAFSLSVCFAMLSKAFFTLDGSATSQYSDVSLPERSLPCGVFASVCAISNANTFQASAKNVFTHCLPMPDAAPVTTTTLAFTEISPVIIRLLHRLT
jgi:hypothetical protein